MSGINSKSGKGSSKQYELIIRFVGNVKDLEIPLSSEMQLKDVSTPIIRRRIRGAKPALARKRLKLIHNGRVLMNHTDFEKELGYYRNMEREAGAPVRIYIHCMVGEDLTDEELAHEEKLEKQPQKSTTEAPKGFDRFLSQGFSQQDVADLRSQFRRIHGGYLSGQSEDSMLNLEDRWIDSTVNNEIDEFPAGLEASGDTQAGGAPGNGAGAQASGAANGANQNGGFVSRSVNIHKDLFVGVCIGFFLGVFAVLLLSMDIQGVFNKRTRMAIVSGVIVNISFGILKVWS